MTEPPVAPIAGKLRFDPVLTWGHILLFVGFILSGFGLYTATELRAADLSYRIAALESIAQETKQANRDLLSELKSLTRELVDIRLNIAGQPPRGGRP